MFSGTVKPAPLKRLQHRALGVAMLFGLLPTVALAAPPQGQWRGVVQQANTDIPADMNFSAQAVVVHFAEPFSCSVPAKFLKANGTVTVYRFAVSANGGRFCDSLINRNLTLTQVSNAQLKVAFDDPRRPWSGELSPQAH